SHLMVIDLVMVTAPNPPESRQLISPLTAVFEIAPANVLHGAVRLHGLASSPTPETQVRVALGFCEPGKRKARIVAVKTDEISVRHIMRPSEMNYRMRDRMRAGPVLSERDAGALKF